MNDQLKRVKTKGMTNSKNHTFLNCPANQTGAVGGTPPTRGVIGGQFKKETWVSCAEAALAGLPADIRNDQAMTHCLGPCVAFGGTGGAVLAPCRMHRDGHDVGLQVGTARDNGHHVDQPTIKQSANDAQLRTPFGFALVPALAGEQSRLRKRESIEVVFHGSGPLLVCGVSIGVVNQWATATVRPVLVLYAMPNPLFGEQHLAGQNGIAFALKSDGKFFRARAGTVSHVLQVATGRINLQGKSLALFNAQALPISFKVHG